MTTVTDARANDLALAELGQNALCLDLEMLDGAYCQFMGEGVACIHQPGEMDGSVFTASVTADQLAHMIASDDFPGGEAWKAQGATVGNVVYWMMGSDLVNIADQEVDEGIVVLTMDNVRKAHAVMTH